MRELRGLPLALKQGRYKESFAALSANANSGAGPVARLASSSAWDGGIGWGLASTLLTKATFSQDKTI